MRLVSVITDSALIRGPARILALVIHQQDPMRGGVLTGQLPAVSIRETRRSAVRGLHAQTGHLQRSHHAQHRHPATAQ